MSHETKLATNPTPETADGTPNQTPVASTPINCVADEDLAVMFEEVHTIPTGFVPAKVPKKFTTKAAA